MLLLSCGLEVAVLYHLKAVVLSLVACASRSATVAPGQKVCTGSAVGASAKTGSYLNARRLVLHSVSGFFWSAK